MSILRGADPDLIAPGEFANVASLNTRRQDDQGHEERNIGEVRELGPSDNLHVTGCDGTGSAARPVIGGPIPETRAVIGGFSIIDVPSREEALEWAARIAVACRRVQELREIMHDQDQVAPETGHCRLATPRTFITR